MTALSGDGRTTVHLLRHGEVHNPDGILYGRRDGFHLSDLGRRMAERVADTIADRDIVHLVTSPLDRTRETIAPLAAVRGLEVHPGGHYLKCPGDVEGEALLHMEELGNYTLKYLARRRTRKPPHDLVTGQTPDYMLSN